MMYPNLRAEMARRGVNMSQLADAIGLTVGKVSARLSGKVKMSLDEAQAIKDVLHTDLPLEVLFSKEAA